MPACHGRRISSVGLRMFSRSCSARIRRRFGSNPVGHRADKYGLQEVIPIGSGSRANQQIFQARILVVGSRNCCSTQHSIVKCSNDLLRAGNRTVRTASLHSGSAALLMEKRRNLQKRCFTNPRRYPRRLRRLGSSLLALAFYVFPDDLIAA